MCALMLFSPNNKNNFHTTVSAPLNWAAAGVQPDSSQVCGKEEKYETCACSHAWFTMVSMNCMRAGCSLRPKINEHVGS